MALGLDVTKQTLDAKVAQTALRLREAFEQIEAVNAWLNNHPSVDNVDPLTADPFGYSEDEAYALRLYFQTFEGVRSANASAFDIGRKMTGLE